MNRQRLATLARRLLASAQIAFHLGTTSTPPPTLPPPPARTDTAWAQQDKTTRTRRTQSAAELGSQLRDPEQAEHRSPPGRDSHDQQLATRPPRPRPTPGRGRARS